MNKLFYIIISVTVALLPFYSISQTTQTTDNGNTFTNPIIHADYSDPDVIRVNDDYYMVASSFIAQPGIPVLHSKDLVNWKIINYVYNQLPFQRYQKPVHGRGSWAPSIRFHAGKFYVYFCTPDEGLFMATTSNPSKQWSLVHVQDVAQWEDPCPFWDEDGKAYLIHGKLCGGPAIVHRMSADGTKLLDNGKIVYQNLKENPTLEGFKIMKRNGFYYIFAPAGGVQNGWQSVLRSKSIYGPYQSKKILAEANGINGPHQGGFVETQTKEWWFIHFQDKGVFGRIVHLQPGGWNQDNWPYIGIDSNNDGIGEPVITYKMPNVGKSYSREVIQTNDDFNNTQLGLQWQWQAAPHASWYSLVKNKGHIRLNAVQSTTEFGNLYYTPHLLLQKLPSPKFNTTTKLTLKANLEGERAGLTLFGKRYSFICIQKSGKQNRVSVFEGGYENCGYVPTEVFGVNTDASTIWLKASVFENGTNTYGYSFDGVQFVEIPNIFNLSKGVWVGAKIGLFCLNPNLVKGQGYADVDYFKIEYKN